MDWIFVVISAGAVIGSALTVYEWRKKRTLLQHDFNLQARDGAGTHAAKVQAEDATRHRISGFDR